jgi:adenylate kinase
VLYVKIILLGPPGSGKGMISEQLERDYNLLHISAGKLLREEVSKETTIGKDIKRYIEQGNLVPNQFVVEMIKLDIAGKKNYILDGFPRTVEQAKAIKDLPIDLVIYLEVPEEKVIKRLAGRRVCETGEHGYHINYIKPKQEGICDVDGTKLVQRKDDTPEVIKDRFELYHKETHPLIEYYSNLGLLKKINASPAPNVVYEEVKRIVEKFSK